MKKYLAGFAAIVLAFTLTGCDLDADLDPGTGQALEKIVDYLEGHYGCQFPDENVTTPEPTPSKYEASPVFVTKDPCLQEVKLGVFKNDNLQDIQDVQLEEDDGTYTAKYDFNITHDEAADKYAYGYQFLVITDTECKNLVENSGTEEEGEDDNDSNGTSGDE